MIDWGADVEVDQFDWASDAEIERVVRLYIDGAQEGDAAKLRDAFHQDAWMFGSIGGRRADMPIADMIAMTDGKPADVDGSYRARIVAIDRAGDAATATVEQDGFWGTASFTDFFTHKLWTFSIPVRSGVGLPGQARSLPRATAGIALERHRYQVVGTRER